MTAGLIVVAASLAAFIAPQTSLAAVAPTTQSTFNDPNGQFASPTAVSDQLRFLVDNADGGSSIRIAIYKFDHPAITDSLLAAYNRGVKVQIVVDYGVKAGGYGSYQRLSSTLGTSAAAASFIVACSQGLACIGGSNAPAGSSPIMHSKMALFSSVGGSQKVVFLTSANFLTAVGGSGDDNYNNAMTVTGRPLLYDAYDGYWADLRDQRRSTNYYGVRTETTYAGYRPFWFPRAGNDSAGSVESSTDTIMDILNNVDCQTRSDAGYGTTSGRPIVRVAMSIWTDTRRNLSTKLRDMDAQGCFVQAIVNSGADSGIISDFTANQGGTYNGIRSWRFDNVGRSLHSKYLLVDGAFNGTKNRKLVFTGSHNFSKPALRWNDETLMRIEYDSIHDAFRSNFLSMTTAPGVRLCTAGGTDGTPTC